MALVGKIVSGSFDVEVNGRKAARKTDLTDHAGVIAGGCPTVVVNGEAFVAARLADPIACPSPDDGGHGGGGAVLGPCSPNVIIGGMFAAREGDPTLCTPGGGGAGAGGGGSGAGGGGGAEKPESECEKLWKKYQDEAKAMIAPAGIDHRERNKIISGAYATLFLNNPEFRWAGLAAYASKQVGCAMDFATDRYDTPLGQQYLYTYNMLGIGNRDLFLDIYPLHRFFQENGFAKMAECAGERRPPVPAQALDGFRAIELYRRTGDPKFLNQSVQSLAWHEQVNVLQREIYNDRWMRKQLRTNEGEWGLYFPPAMSPAAVAMTSGCSDPGGRHTLRFRGNKGRTRIFDVDERMDWILGDVARNYLGFVGTKRHLDDLKEIQRHGAMAGGVYP